MSGGAGKKFSWGPVAAAAPVSLADVMSEELANHLNKQELSILSDQESPSIRQESAVATATPQPNEPPEQPGVQQSDQDDLLIAQMLQKQFDREYDEALHLEENHMNGSSKVRVSYSKYRMLPENHIWSDSEDEDEYFTQDDQQRDWDMFETNEKEVGVIPRCGYKKLGEKMITKHDREITQRENAKRIMEFPPGIHTGDGGGFDMQVSNKVYNKIRNFSVKEGKRKNRLQDKEERAVTDQAVDPKTRVILFKMVNGGILDAINGVISTGKEAVIMHAEGGPGPDEGPDIPLNVPKECAVKVFKTTLNEFKTRDKYIRDDYRFKDRFGKQNPRKIVHMWAEKELHNLLRLAKGGIRVPDVVVLKNHVLVMSFIGSEGKPAPKLKDAAERMTKSQIESAYEQVQEMMVSSYNICHLVHADLSEYNILWHDGECWFIDVSQSVEPIHPSGLHFLFRDCTNITNFFWKWGVEDIPSEIELFNKITGLDLKKGSESELLSQINNYQKDQLLRGGIKGEAEGEWNEDANFEYCWKKASGGGGGVPSAAVKIPGHQSAKPVSKSPKSPRSPKSPKSPGTLSSHKKSPMSDLVALSDASLKEMKDALLNSDKSEPTVVAAACVERKSAVSFEDCS